MHKIKPSFNFEKVITKIKENSQTIREEKYENLTFGDGTTEYVFMILSGYSSLIFEMSKVPIPDPVPPPNECVSWKPCKQSQPSASFL